MKMVTKFLGSLLALCLTIGLTAPAVYGASTISTVNIRVGINDFEAGDHLPDIVINDRESADTAYVSSNSSHYLIAKAEWITSQNRAVRVGDMPRMKIWLEPTDYDSRRFKGGYNSSNVKITGGSFKSASLSNRNLVVVLDLNPIKGQFEMPEEAYWNNSGYGRAKWKMGSDNSERYQYEVVLYRGSTQMHKAETTNTVYNFYPYMTKAGVYSFRVRVIPKNSEEEKYGKKSEWTISDEVYLPEEDVSKGAVPDTAITPSGGSTSVGWIQNGGKWYFRYPDGTSPKDGWLAWNEKWYLFDSEGWMLTGWQDYNGQTYYLDASGAMLTGWVQHGNTFYYLNPTKDAYEGALVRNSWIMQDGNYYYLNQDAIRSEGWSQVGENWYYFYPGTGIRAQSTFIDGFWLDSSGVWQKQ